MSNYEIRCEKCGSVIADGETRTFDLMSLKNGEQLVKKRFGVDNVSMALVAMCERCYEEGMLWIQRPSS